MVPSAVDRDSKLREITDTARAARKPLPRWLWTWSIAISVVCVGALAIAMIEDCDTKPVPVKRAQ